MLFLYLFNLTKTKSHLLILAVFLAGIAVPIAYQYVKPTTAKQAPNNDFSNFSVFRLSDFQYIKPYVYGEFKDETAEFPEVKTELARITDSLVQAGMANKISVHFRELETGNWLGIHESEHFHPASLMKVPLLLAMLRKFQNDPSVFDQKIKYVRPEGGAIQPQYFISDSIQSGQTYTVHELLYHMVANSDNNATYALASRFDNEQVLKVFETLGLPKPVEDDLRFTISPKEYSRIFYAIFNSSFLAPEYSEYAAELMANCSFKEGFRKGFPKHVKLWHKFGEWRHAGFDYELHESGVVYLGNKPYSLTVMTKGGDTQNLATSIAILTNRLYHVVVKHS